MENVNTNYAVVKLLRCDEIFKSKNESVNSVSLNNATEIDVSNQITEVKRNTRLSRKRTFQEKSAVEDYDQAIGIKKKKCMVKKPQSSKTESARSVVPLKDTKKLKSPIPIPVKSSSTNSDFNDISDTISSSIDVNNVSNECGKNEKLVPLKMPKSKISHCSTSIKKSPISNVHKDTLSNDFVRNDNSFSLKSPKNKLSKSNIPAKKRFLVNNIYKDNTSKEDVLNDNSVLLKSTKNKSSKSDNAKKSFVVNNTTDFEESDNLTSLKVLRNKSSTKSSIKKRPMMHNVKKNDMVNEVDEKSNALVTKKRGRPSLKKGQLPNSNSNNICDNEFDSKLTTNMVVYDELPNFQETESLKDPNDNMMMLRSNNKPPKIKKKWSEEWSGDRLLNNVLKSNNDDHLEGLKIDLNKCCKTIKKVVKTPKSKNINYKKVKTKMLEKLNTNTNDSILIKSPNTNVHIDMSNTNIPEVQNQGQLLIINSIPPAELEVTKNDLIIEPDNNKNITDVPFICDKTKSIKTTSSSEVTVQPKTSTELSTPSIEIPTTSTNFSNNEVSYENDHPSNLITPELTFESNYSSFHMGYSENTEISYGISILSEAISRQCRESNEETVKTKSLEQDINEIPSSPKKTSSRSQVPSAIVSPQKVNEHKNKSKNVVKYNSGVCEPSIQTDLQSRAEREIILLSKRYNIPIDALRKTVVEEPLSVFHKKYSESITPSMITISPIVKDVETKIKPSKNFLSGNLDVEYKVEPIREAAAYEKTNLKDLMEELTKTMPSWCLCIVTNPSRYVISNMSINTYGVPSANKVIVLDKFFRASVYINQSLEHRYCKPYTTATEIVNLIKELNSI